MPGTRNSIPTLSTGDWITAGWMNTYIGDNESAHWPFTTAGDLAYALSNAELTRLGIGAAGALLKSSGSAPAWLGIGSAGQVLRVIGGAPAWGQAPFVVASHNNATGHNYATGTWRDMPNSSAGITPLVTSTILAIAIVNNYGQSTYGFRQFKFNIDGSDDDAHISQEHYALNEIQATAVIGYKTGVTAGAKTVKLREICTAGQFTVESKSWLAIAIPQ